MQIYIFHFRTSAKNARLPYELRMSSRDRVLLLPIVVQDSEMLWQQALSVAARREDTTPAKKKRDVKPAWISSAVGSTSGRSNCSSFASPSISNSCGLGNSQDQACPPSSLSSSRSSCFAGSSSARSEEWRASARRRTHDHAASFEDVGRPPLVHVEEDGESTSSSADDDEVASLRSSIPGRRLWDTRAVYPAGVDKCMSVLVGDAASRRSAMLSGFMSTGGGFVLAWE